MSELADTAELARARLWGLAIRLGQRLSGGVAEPLKRSRLELDAERLWLCLADRDDALYGETVERRHKALASAFGRSAALGG